MTVTIVSLVTRPLCHVKRVTPKASHTENIHHAQSGQLYTLHTISNIAKCNASNGELLPPAATITVACNVHPASIHQSSRDDNTTSDEH